MAYLGNGEPNSARGSQVTVIIDRIVAEPLLRTFDVHGDEEAHAAAAAHHLQRQP